MRLFDVVGGALSKRWRRLVHASAAPWQLCIGRSLAVMYRPLPAHRLGLRTDAAGAVLQ